MKTDCAKLAIVAFCCFTTGVWAQVLPTALLIGNSAYQHTGTLANPSQDARALSQVLSKRGFEVVLALNLGKEQLSHSVADFATKLKTSRRGVLYFAGHGVQVANDNYLLPVDIRNGSSEAIVGGSISLNAILAQLASVSPDAVAVILDACRDNPFAAIASADQSSAGRNVAATATQSDEKIAVRGLGEAGQDIPRGVLVAYGASAGQSAIDSLGSADTSPNGLFTRHLLHFMADDKMTLQQVLRRTRDTVMSDAKAVQHRQIPSVYDSSYPDRQLFAPAISQTPVATTALPKQIRIVVPGARRGQSDFIARRFGEALKTLGIETEVDNVIDTRGDRVAALAYPFDATKVTLLMSSYLSSLRREITGDRRFQPLGMLTETPIMLAANKKHGINNMRSLMEKSLSRTGPWRVGSSSPSSDSDACSTVLKVMMGREKVESIATRGVGPALAALATGNLDLFCDSQQVIDNIIRSDAVHYVANLQEDALSADGIPTAQMQGFAWVVPNWQALFAPRELPSEAVLALANVLQKVVRDPEYKADLARQAAKAAAPEKANPLEVEMSLRLGVELSK